MAGFTTHSGKLAIVPQDNIDTDRIIPARFLTRIDRSGYGELLFNDVRGTEFPLDHPEAKGASVLVVGTNFGCGSSREHAVWAIQQAGFRAVLSRRDPKSGDHAESPGFSDIFRQNAANCGLLLAEIAPEGHNILVSAGQGTEVEVNLPDQVVTVNGHVIPFEIGAATKEALIAGLDLIGTTLVHAEEIATFEARLPSFVTSSQR
jgi:3-isopropylmalate/(R)-2-methylmalate dehydratase small subunit